MRMISTALGGFALATVSVAAPANATTLITDTDGSWTARYLGSGSAIDLNTVDLATAGTSIDLVDVGTVTGLSGAKRLRQSGAGTAAAGIYVFTQVFTLSNVGSVQSVALRWLADNQLFAVVVNGAIVFRDAIQINKAPDASIQSRAVNFAGSPLETSNTMHWLVWNRQTSNNNVSLAAEGITTAVPEPGTWLLMILGLGAVGFAMRRRHATAVRYQFA